MEIYGIVFGRIDATYLNYLIDKRVNLLEYIEFKIFRVTSGSSNLTFEMLAKDREDDE